MIESVRVRATKTYIQRLHPVRERIRIDRLESWGPWGLLEHNDRETTWTLGDRQVCVPFHFLFPIALETFSSFLTQRHVITLGQFSSDRSVPHDAIRGTENWRLDDCEVIDSFEIPQSVAKIDAQRFVASANRYRDVAIASGPPPSYVLQLCKLQGQISVEDILRGWRDGWEQPSEQGLSPWSADENAQAVRSIIENLIMEDKLKGVFDPEQQAYVGSEFILRKSQSVHINVELDFNAVLQQLGYKGVSLTSIRCPHCGGPCGLPEGSSKQFQCEYCHSGVHVMDVFAQFRDLLG